MCVFLNFTDITLDMQVLSMHNLHCYYSKFALGSHVFGPINVSKRNKS